MNSVGSLVGVTVKVGSYDSLLLDTVKGCLSGYIGGYYFFQYDDDDFCLILSDDYDYSSTGVFTASDCEVFQFRRIVDTTSRTITIPFSGNQSGTYTGSDGAGGFTGSLSGSSSVQVYDSSVSYCMMSYSVSSVSVSNPDLILAYGDSEYLPHLQSGGDYYAFFAVCAFCAVVAFKLADRLFRRVY